MRRLLWTLQILLALVFALGGPVKLLGPNPLPLLPDTFVRFIGLCETLAALGLILPSLLRIQPWLTPLAGLGLVILMSGATLLTPIMLDGQLAPALLPLMLGVMAGVVAYGRWRIVPIAPRTRVASLHFATR